MEIISKPFEVMQFPERFSEWSAGFKDLPQQIREMSVWLRNLS